jgi:hypothetical protein
MEVIMFISKFRKSILSVSAIVLLLAVLTGCDSASVDSQFISSYRAEGGLVLDQNSDSAYVSVRFERNDTLLVAAALWYGDDSLTFNNPRVCICNAFSACHDSLMRYAGSTERLVMTDEDRFVDTVTRTAVDTFSITNFVPANHLIQGNGQVSLEWGPSANADAYVMAAVKADEVYSNEGYSLYAPLAATAGTIPPDAFLIEGTNQVDTGLYNVYVYALNGSPDSALTAYQLPVPLPDQLSDDIDERYLSGRFGSVIVSRKDTVRVAQQQ